MVKISKETPATWKARLRSIPKPRPTLKMLAAEADRHPSLISDYVNAERVPSDSEILHIELACQRLILQHKKGRRKKK